MGRARAYISGRTAATNLPADMPAFFRSAGEQIERIINNAGTLGRYVTDGANPHHTTIHFNGWAVGAPNPQGYTTDNTFHRRFESEFVGARITISDLLPMAPMTPPRRRLSVTWRAKD